MPIQEVMIPARKPLEYKRQLSDILGVEAFLEDFLSQLFLALLAVRSGHNGHIFR